MSNLTVTLASTPLQVLPTGKAKPTETAKPAEGKAPAAGGDSASSSTKKGISAASVLSAMGAGAAVTGGLNAYSAYVGMEMAARSNPIGAILVGESGLNAIARSNAITRAGYGAGLGALAGALVATQTDDKMAAFGAGVLVGGIAGVLLNPTVEGVARYASIGGAGAFAASVASGLVKK